MNAVCSILALLVPAHGLLLGVNMPQQTITSMASSHRVSTLRMSFFDDLKKGLAKVQAGSYDEAEVKKQVLLDIKRKPCIVYSFTTCPFCKSVQKTLTDMGAIFSLIELDEVEGGKAIRAELAGITGRTSMPSVFVGGEFVGGANDGGLGGVLTLEKEGKLKPLLIKAGSLTAGSRI